MYYSIQVNDTPMIARSGIEASLLSLSAVYIIRNKLRQPTQILPA